MIIYNLIPFIFMAVIIRQYIIIITPLPNITALQVFSSVQPMKLAIYFIGLVQPLVYGYVCNVLTW